MKRDSDVASNRPESKQEAVDGETRSAAEKLADYGVATVYEASGREGLVDVRLTPLLPDAQVAGPAITVRCGQGDNLMVHAAIEHIRPGHVVVLVMPEPEPVALLGDLLAEQMLRRGAAGVLVDAAVRDAAQLIELGLPVWTRYVRARGPGKAIVGEVNGPVEVGGCPIAAGDFVVLDADGACVVRADRVNAVLGAAAKRERQEASMRAAFERGELSIDLMFLRGRLGEGERED